jgi:GT2 family glycosyltransferase
MIVKVDVIVVNYRTLDDLQTFLASYIVALKFLPADIDSELWICDVDPVDKYVNTNDFYGYPFHLLEWSSNVGYAHAVNEAAAQGNGEILAIFNADVVLSDPSGIWKCARALYESADWGVLGPLQRDERGRCTHPGIFGTLDNPTWRDGWMVPLHDGLRDVRDDAVTVTGSAYFVDRFLWDELTTCPIYQKFHVDRWQTSPIGAFLPTPLYYEETFCSWHARSHGWKICYFGEVELQHNWHRSIDQNHMEYQAGQWFNESREIFRAACDAHNIMHD